MALYLTNQGTLMKKLLWTALLFSGFALAQQTGDIQDMPESADALIAACDEQVGTLPAEAVDMFKQTCSCLAEAIDFDKVKELKEKNDQEGLVAQVQEATIACAPQIQAQ